MEQMPTGHGIEKDLGFVCNIAHHQGVCVSTMVWCEQYAVAETHGFLEVINTVQLARNHPFSFTKMTPN
jgi:hypothetical protein